MVIALLSSNAYFSCYYWAWFWTCMRSNPWSVLKHSHNFCLYWFVLCFCRTKKPNLLRLAEKQSNALTLKPNERAKQNEWKKKTNKVQIKCAQTKPMRWWSTAMWILRLRIWRGKVEQIWVVHCQIGIIWLFPCNRVQNIVRIRFNEFHIQNTHDKSRRLCTTNGFEYKWAKMNGWNEKPRNRNAVALTAFSCSICSNYRQSINHSFKPLVFCLSLNKILALKNDLRNNLLRQT